MTPSGGFISHCLLYKQTMSNVIPLTFVKGDRKVTHHLTEDDMYFEINDYPEGMNRIFVEDSETFNFMCNLLIDSGYESPIVI